MGSRLLIVDSFPILRNGLRETLAQQPNLELVGEASSGAQAIRMAREQAADVVLMDIQLADMKGAEAVRRLSSSPPSPKVIILSADISRGSVDEALAAGARGYLSTSASLDDLMQAINQVVA